MSVWTYSTVTVKLAVPTFPAASDAVQVTVVVPTGNVEPEEGEQVGPEVTPTSSDAVTVNIRCIYPVELVVDFAMLDGTVIIGRVVSVWTYSTVTVKLAVPTFPAESVAVHVTVVVPSGNTEPEEGVHVGPEVTARSSVAAGSQRFPVSQISVYVTAIPD